MTDVPMRRIRHQLQKVPATDMNERDVITGLKVHIGKVPQTLIHYRLNAVGRRKGRNGTGLAVAEESNDLALARQFNRPVELVANGLQVESVTGGQDGHEVTVLILEHHTFGELIPGDVSCLRTVRAILRV